jgi:hypothetical protein
MKLFFLKYSYIYLEIIFKMAAPMITICETDTQVAEKLCAFVIAKANESFKANGSFYVGLSGIDKIYLNVMV